MMWQFCLHSLLREYGWQFVVHVAAPHPLRTARAAREAVRLDVSGDLTAVPSDASDLRLEGARSIVGLGFCLKPVSPPCPSDRATHDCRYLETLAPSGATPVPSSCQQCAIGEIGLSALRAGAALYIMTSARDILHDVFVPSLQRGRFSSGLFVLCRYSLRPFALGLMASGVEGWLFPLQAGVCRDYGTWLLADRGVKTEQTVLGGPQPQTIRGLLEGAARRPAIARFEKHGNVFCPTMADGAPDDPTEVP